MAEMLQHCKDVRPWSFVLAPSLLLREGDTLLCSSSYSALHQSVLQCYPLPPFVLSCFLHHSSSGKGSEQQSSSRGHSMTGERPGHHRDRGAVPGCPSVTPDHVKEGLQGVHADCARVWMERGAAWPF